MSEAMPPFGDEKLQRQAEYVLKTYVPRPTLRAVLLKEPRSIEPQPLLVVNTGYAVVGERNG